MQPYVCEHDKVITAYYARLIRSIVTSKQRTRLSQLTSAMAADHGLPPELLLGLALVETYCRPAWLRTLETIVLRAFLELYLRLRTPVPDLSVGLFQIKISSAATHLKIPRRLRGSWVWLPQQPEVRRRVFRALRNISSDEMNTRLAAVHVMNLIKSRGSTLYRSFLPGKTKSAALNPEAVQVIGALYNAGHVDQSHCDTTVLSYGKVLADVALALNVGGRSNADSSV